jgi:phage terminase large subunit-like protein
MNCLEEYRDKAKKGEIIVGREMMTGLDKYYEELSDERYYYDTSDYELRSEFMENFIKLTKSPFYGKPMQLMLWQKAFLETLYSFKRKDTGLRRFKKAILLIARKNTKSETCNAIGDCELMLGNSGSDIVCSSNDDNQANILFDGMNTMREMFDPKGEITHKNLQFIKNKLNGSKIFKLSDRTRNKEGRNIDFAIVDEVHEMKDNIIVKSIETSQSTKDEPLLILITTEGFVYDGYLDKELKYARQVLNGEIEDDTYLVWLYTQDSEQEVWQDEKSWYKSNPTLGIVKKWDYLRDQLNKARYSTEDRAFVLAKDFNIKQNATQMWLMDSDYTYIQEESQLADFKNRYCFGAVDLSQTTDLSNAKILLMRPNDNKKYIFSKYFIPQSKLQDSNDKEAGAKYEEWARDGLCEIHEGNAIDLAKIAEWFKSLYTDYGIMVYKLGYDQRFAKDFLETMKNYGYGYNKGETCEMINQSKYVMSVPMKMVEADLKSQLIHGLNDMDKWCLSNTSFEIDGQQNIMPIKVTASKRIDGAVTLIILYAIFMRYRNDYMKSLK